MKLDKPRLPVSLIESTEELEPLLAALASQDRIGLDAERASGFRYSQKAYLIQVAIKNQQIYLIDPLILSPKDLEKLAAAMKKPTWLLHAATQDLPCLADLGLRPSAIIDTELAARIGGLEKVGLGSLAGELLDLELAKEHSAADWSLRPLSQAMLDYAALDVDVMEELWVSLEAILSASGKLDFVQEEFDNLLSFSPKPPLAEPWRSLPGLSKVRDLSKLKIAASLHATRDGIAVEKDIAPGRLIPDRSIMAAVNQVPKTKSELAQNKEFQGRASRTLLDTWWNAIWMAKDLSIELSPMEKGNGIPNHRSWEKRFPDAYARLEAVRPLVLARALELQIPVENLLTPEYLRRVCFEPETDVSAQLRGYGARRWQVAQVVDLITEGLEKASVEDPLLEA